MNGLRILDTENANRTSRRIASLFLGRSTQVVLTRLSVVGATLVLVVQALLGASKAPGNPLPGAASELSLSDISRNLVETARIYEAVLSPDGMFVAYSISRKSVDKDLATIQLFLQPLDIEGDKRGPAKLIEERSSVRVDRLFSPKWRPGSLAFSYYSTQQQPSIEDESTNTIGNISPTASRRPATLVLYDVEFDHATPIVIKHVVPFENTSGTTDSAADQLQVPPDFRWSTDGRSIGFIASVGSATKLDPTKGMVQTPELLWRGVRRQGLHVLDVASGRVERLTPDSMNISDFAWSPDDTELAICATDSRTYEYQDGVTLRIVKRATGVARTLASKPGAYSPLAWSPDGKWIAFGDRKRNDLRMPIPSIISVSSPDHIIHLMKDGEPYMDGVHLPQWMPDSRSFYYSSDYHLAAELVHADIIERRVTLVLPEDEYTHSAPSFSTDRKRVIFQRGSMIAPKDIYVATLPSGKQRPITDIASGFPFKDAVRLERIEWPSRDGLFTVHGLLVTPRTVSTVSAGTGHPPLPTIVFNHGGPGMVPSSFGVDGYNNIIMALALRGYAVLSPNTRGRSGYSEAFKNSTDTGSAYYKLGYQDMMAGIDILVKRRIADPERLGLVGHSYGANLASYAVTQTNRFKTAVIHEARSLHTVDLGLTYQDSFDDNGVKIIHGFFDPFSEATYKRIIDESPFFHLGKIRTPLLLQFGSQGEAGDIGDKLYKVMLRLKVPCEFVVYDAGHIVFASKLAVDEVSQAGSWLDYWLRDMSYTDKDREREFTAWRNATRPAQEKAQRLQ